MNGGERTGIRPGEPTLRLAQLIDSLPNLKFAGLQAYAGYASHVIGFEERRKVSMEAMAPADDVAVVDGGFKAFSTDKPFTPERRNFEGLMFNWAGDEHGILKNAWRTRSSERLAIVLSSRFRTVIQR
jgi:D-serine deaminase-like pyridoxal phosphate-dependent protein